MNARETAENGALRTPEEWCALLDARILDHDGWRDADADWYRPITRAEFDRRLNLCTIDGRRYPSFIGRVVPPGESAS